MPDISYAYQSNNKSKNETARNSYGEGDFPVRGDEARCPINYEGGDNEEN